MSHHNYTNESIHALKGADRVRLRPSVIFGSDDIEGCQHSFFEILSNSIDEAREGYGKKITVTRFLDDSLQVEDQGRGIPLDFNEVEQRYNWELVYCELYAGGKYSNLDGGNYAFSLGLNGLGACATQYASSSFDVKVKRDGYVYELHFEKGENKGGLVKTPYSGKDTGTLQRWKPDLDVFTDIDLPHDFLVDTIHRQAVVNAGIEFRLVDQKTNTDELFCYPEGIFGFVKELNGENALSEPCFFEAEGSGRDREDKPDYRVKAACCFAFNPHQPTIQYYHNSSWLEYGGSPDRAARSAFVAEFDREIKQQNKYKSNESKISFNDIQDSLILVISSFSTYSSYENQTKKAINNRYIQNFLTETIRENLHIWFIENQAIAAKVVDQILVNKRSRETAEKQRQTLKKKLLGQIDNLYNRVKNFVDCRSREVEKRELYIVEGNSALGSVKMARDAEFQAVIPLRGKILNCLKANYTQIFKNDIIMDLIRILGCGVELEGHAKKNNIAPFDLSQLRWNRIVICTDADVDGFQIRTLILAMLYRLTPQLIEEGKVYIAESPLFEITHVTRSTEQTFFAYSEKEKRDILSGLTGGKIHVQRSKGLGENEPEMMWLTTMNPETRRLIQILPEEPDSMKETFELLLGDNLQGRKEYIENFGSDYLEMLDVM